MWQERKVIIDRLFLPYCWNAQSFEVPHFCRWHCSIGMPAHKFVHLRIICMQRENNWIFEYLIMVMKLRANLDLCLIKYMFGPGIAGHHLNLSSPLTLSSFLCFYYLAVRWFLDKSWTSRRLWFYEGATFTLLYNHHITMRVVLIS